MSSVFVLTLNQMIFKNNNFKKTYDLLKIKQKIRSTCEMVTKV